MKHISEIERFSLSPPIHGEESASSASGVWWGSLFPYCLPVLFSLHLQQVSYHWEFSRWFRGEPFVYSPGFCLPCVSLLVFHPRLWNLVWLSLSVEAYSLSVTSAYMHYPSKVSGVITFQQFPMVISRLFEPQICSSSPGQLLSHGPSIPGDFQTGHLVHITHHCYQHYTTKYISWWRLEFLTALLLTLFIGSFWHI